MMIIFAILVSNLGLLIFLQGFLMTKHQLHFKSEQSSNYSYDNNDIIDISHGGEHNNGINNDAIDGNNVRRPKVLLFIIDALRYDFMIPLNDNDIKSSSSSSSSSSMLPLLTHLLTHNSSQCLFYQTFVDPPTTTSQRLKALTTGTLPTFIEFTSNFGSDVIGEDNIIDQLKSHGKRLIMLGDDTWMSLYPNQFDVSYPFDSFNTQDIHTVDNGIQKHLFKYLNSIGDLNNSLGGDTVWDFLVAHFLGVDHIGHTYSAWHPLMRDKLQQMNDLLGETINRLPDDTTLMVFGDHGMTNEGEHGGASYDETISGLFIYRQKGFRNYAGSTEDKQRLDLQSGGYYWSKQQDDWMWRNARDIQHTPQIISQIDLVPTISFLLNVPVPFSNLGTVIPELFVTPIVSIDKVTVDSERIRKLLTINTKQVIKYLTEYARGGHLEETLLSYLDNSSNFEQDNVSIPSLMTVLTEIITRARYQWTCFDLPLMILGSVCVALGLSIVSWKCRDILNIFWVQLLNTQIQSCDLQYLLTALTGLYVTVSIFSNSFIIEEHHANYFLCQLSIFIMISYCLPRLDVIVRCIACVFSMKLQWMLSSITGESIQNQQEYIYESGLQTAACAVGVALVMITFAIPRQSSNQSCTGFHRVMSVCRRLTTISIIFGTLYRVIDASHGFVPYSDYFKLALANLSLFFCIVPLFLSWMVPRWLRISYSHFGSDMLEFRRWNCSVLHCLLANSAKSALCASLYYFIATQLIEIVLGLWDYSSSLSRSPQIRWISILEKIVSFFYPCNYSLASSANLDTRYFASYRVDTILFPVVIFVFMLGKLLYSVTGHTYSFSSLQLSVGFYGMPTFHFYYAGVLLGYNTFAHEIESILLIAVLESYLTQSQRSGQTGNIRKHCMMKIYLLLRIAIILGSCICGFVHRRHLMMWAIFAPKIIMELCTWFMASAAILCYYLC